MVQVSNLDITEVIVIHCNIVNNDYQQDSLRLYQLKSLVCIYS